MAAEVQGDYRLLFPSRFASSADLKERDVTFLIDRVERDSLKMTNGKSETKAILYFKTKDGRAVSKGLVLNKTNATAIASLYGKKVEAWKGKPVTLYPTTCKFGPATVDCVRIRARPGSASGDVPTEFTEPVLDAPEDDFADQAAGPEDSPHDAAARAHEETRGPLATETDIAKREAALKSKKPPREPGSEG